MALKEIVTFPDPFLRLKAKPVKKFDKDLQTLIDDMFETMRAEPGVGLAAPQIGESMRLVVIEYAEEPEDEEASEPKPKRYVLVNPEITQKSEEMVEGMEGCLSWFDRYCRPPRKSHCESSDPPRKTSKGEG